MPFDVLLLRHGLTDSNQNGILQGHLPIELNDLGRRQAAQLARRVATWRPPVKTLVSSDLRRALQTAEAISKTCALPVIEDATWRERGLGEFEGKTVGEKAMWLAATGDETPPGAEPPESFAARIVGAFRSLPERFVLRDPIAVITHGGPMRVILRMFCDGQLPLAQSQALPLVERIGNCSVWHFQLSSTGWSIACANDTSHLDESTAADAG